MRAVWTAFGGTSAMAAIAAAWRPTLLLIGVLAVLVIAVLCWVLSSNDRTRRAADLLRATHPAQHPADSNPDDNATAS
jgi:predicted MFS family arabinose efflux permease